MSKDEQGLIEQSWTDAVNAGAVLLTVNQRLAREYVHRYSLYQQQSGHAAWPTPAILPWRTWLSSQLDQLAISGKSDRVLMPAVVQQQLWREIVEGDKPTHRLLDEQGAARQAVEAWNIAHAWGCMPSALDAHLSADQFAFERWSRAYTKHRDTLQFIDEASLPDHLCSLIHNDPSLITLPDQILMAGFLETTPQQEKWIECLQAQGCKVVAVNPSQTAKARAVAYMDDDAELLGVACAARAALEANPGQKLGVVIPNLHQRRAACLRLFDQQFFPSQSPQQIESLGRPYDISLGTPIDEQAVVKAALLVLQLKLGVLRESSIAELVLSPYVGNADSEFREREKLDRQLRQKRMEQVGLIGLIKETQSSSAKLRKALVKVSEVDTGKARGCAAWSIVFGQVLDSSGWPGAGISSAEYQAVQSWKRCLDDLQLLDNGKKISANKAMNLLRELLRDRLFQLETPACPIQIMGRLESHGIEFDKLWVCGMDASQWPAPTSPTPFLPIGLQKEVGVPQADSSTRLQLAMQEVSLWLKSTPELVFSFSKTRDGANVIPAAMVSAGLAGDESLQAISLNDASVKNYAHPAALVQQVATLESIEDTHGAKLPEGSPVRGGARLLENQSECPFRAFALHRLNIKPLEEAGLGLDARQHGTLLHFALELFWSKMKTSTALLALDEAQLHLEIDAATEKALDELELGKALRSLEHKRLHRLLYEWIELQEKPRRIPFEAVEFETKREIHQNGIVLTLLVDRIDRLATGEKLVIDYKTGVNNRTKDWEEERIRSPQLPLYALTDDEIQGVTFAQLARHKYKFLGVGADTFVPNMTAAQDWDATVSDWRARIDAIALEIKQGLATITPTKNACQFCDVLPLCRIEKQAVEEADEWSAYTGGPR
ncbi:MAG: PD-(D/E)XK nuclease family protein [Granulosicoccaceae bacterium]